MKTEMIIFRDNFMLQGYVGNDVGSLWEFYRGHYPFP